MPAKSIEAARESRRKHYRNNRAQYYARNAKSEKQKREYLNQLKSAPCKDCGNSFPPYVMDFDHLDGEKKIGNVGNLVTNSWRKLKEEVAKCEIVCSNCHRIRTHNRVSGVIG